MQGLLLSVFLLLPNIPVGDDHLSVCPLLLLLLHQKNSLWDKVMMMFLNLSVTQIILGARFSMLPLNFTCLI